MAESGITFKTSSGLIQGAVDERFGRPIWHFRGIPYEYVELTGENLDPRKFGPQCPQPDVDVGHLLRLPKHISSPHIDQDEFKCLNLNISRPSQADIAGNGLLPMLVWVHGGSQCVTFASAATAVCDPTRFTAHSVDFEKPVIIVTVNYRLNIFAFGDGTGQKNLALQDQRLALEWVSRNIKDFGGDPEQITLAGESAGAIYTHAHIVSKSSSSKTDLASRGDTLKDGSAESLVQALVNCGISTMWLQQEPELEKWEQKVGEVDALMISDTEYKLMLRSSSKLEELYHIHPDRPQSCRHDALDIINDARFALPALEMAERWRKTDGKKIYQYIVDEANPRQASSRAHHAVDLIFLFGSVDLSFKPGAEAISRKMREAWLTFIHGGSPWAQSSIQAFGPLGRYEEIDTTKYRLRRRMGCFEYLRTLGSTKYREVSGRLGTARINLLN
ncbi:Alpha/Beta hydrolase protein [Dactylonectria macrodidyma]|uniref:Carboxylic ester hydrolase n=1 Tax=Dactylonectria macrodidyma TaxID=307937 RepID=A0A9P9I704_9HYPO|nr:Alpha/Beta hydrolase protein [Dactylonectria macrodidyma]